jgi:hypothetical protein
MEKDEIWPVLASAFDEKINGNVLAGFFQLSGSLPSR